MSVHISQRPQDPRQRKALSQVFLKVAWPCERVVEYVQRRDRRHVLEIGPGGGALTKHLLDAGLCVTSVEKDMRFADWLQHEFASRLGSDLGQLNIVRSNILEFDLHQWVAQHGTGSSFITGNIPYSISTAIVMQLLELDSLTRPPALFLVQKEFAQRLAAKTSTKAYGALSVYCQLRADVEYVCEVPRSCFKPVPKVDSALVALIPKETALDTAGKQLTKESEPLVKAFFQKRRKKVRASLKSLLPEVKEDQWPPFFHDISNLRPENLSPSQYLEMTAWVREFDPKKTARDS